MRFHVVGIGGAGMSAVARLLMAHGEVSGSDRGRWPLSEALVPLGATVHDTFDPAHVQGADVVVRSSAYREDNPEVAAALAKGIPVWKRHDAWRFLAKGKRVIAVAGTHGKTTTTAMAWTALQQAGVDASLICGAALRHTRSNAHVGRSDVLVIEADEYDRVFHALEPTVAVVTNVDHDHVDLFPSRGSYMEAFRLFVAGIKPAGTLIACADDPGSAALAREAKERLAGRNVMTYGNVAGTSWTLAGVHWMETAPVPVQDAVFIRMPDGSQVGVGLKVQGRHNVLNAMGALAAATLIGAEAKRAAAGLSAFAGTDRRLEELGSAGGVTVVDDYAHHPAEIEASIEATRWRGGRIVALFQPHTPSRLAAFFDDFVEALRKADEAIVAETFSSVREPSAEGARALAEAAGAAYARDAEEAARMLADRVRPGDTVLVLGAGDIRPAGERLLELLRAKVRA